MIKKSILIALSICLIFSFSCFAETADETTPVTPPSTDSIPFQGIDPRNGSMPPRENFGGNQPPAENSVQPQEAPAGTEIAVTDTDVTEIPDETPSTENMQEKPVEDDRNMQSGPMMPGGMNDWNNSMKDNVQNAEPEQSGGVMGFLKEYQTPVISIVILILAFIFVNFYKRKHY